MSKQEHIELADRIALFACDYTEIILAYFLTGAAWFLLFAFVFLVVFYAGVIIYFPYKFISEFVKRRLSIGN